MSRNRLKSGRVLTGERLLLGNLGASRLTSRSSLYTEALGVVYELMEVENMKEGKIWGEKCKKSGNPRMPYIGRSLGSEACARLCEADILRREAASVRRW